MTISDHCLLSYCNNSMHVRCAFAQARPTMSCIKLVIGASLSEPHTSESNSAIVSMVRTSTESKYKILILRITHYVCEAQYAQYAYATAFNNCMCTSRQNGSYWKFAGPIGQGTSI